MLASTLPQLAVRNKNPAEPASIS